MDITEISEYNKAILRSLYQYRSDDGKFILLRKIDPKNTSKGLRKLETDKLVLLGLIEYSDKEGGFARITNNGVQFVENYLLQQTKQAENPVKE